MLNSQILSRRPEAAVDFRPTPDLKSPAAQVRRLSVHLSEPSNPPPGEDITDCPDALSYLREYTYRKIFTATTHDEYVALDKSDPAAIDWLIRIHEVASGHFQSRKQR